jgi:hypothetical protein
LIRESEDLPEQTGEDCEDGGASDMISVDKKGLSRIDFSIRDFFLPRPHPERRFDDRCSQEASMAALLTDGQALEVMKVLGAHH